MYFNARLSIDPSQLTKIEREEPDETFGKILHFITGGAASKKVERETFAAVSILQKLHRLFWEMEISNIIRLSHDDIDIYIDNHGRDNDLKEALDQYELTINDAMSHRFKTIHMVLEHEDSNFIYLIEIDINRSHAVGAYPIQLKINGLMKEFRADSTGEAVVRKKMKAFFESQDMLNAFIKEKQLAFETVVNEMAMKVRKFIKVDDVKVAFDKRLILPKDKGVRKIKKIKRADYEYDPVFGGYFGFGEMMLYSFLWSEMLHDHHIHVENVTLVGENADVLGEIGAEGLDAGASGLFDNDLDIDTRLDGFESADMDMSEAVADTGSDSWFDFDGGDFDFGDYDI